MYVIETLSPNDETMSRECKDEQDCGDRGVCESPGVCRCNEGYAGNTTGCNQGKLQALSRDF